VKSLGLFEAKTRLSELCQEVADTGESVMVTKRGKPLVRIVPVAADAERGSSIWELRERDEASNGAWSDDFELPPRELQVDTYNDPFSEG
jgi:prevent-host-death family protein